ncbi:hypothetical protein ScPMuIL_006152 [Solemya velum]
MSIITLQLGQCGNQIGGQLFQTLVDDIYAKPTQTQISPTSNQEYKEQALETFFRFSPGITDAESEQLKARAVMVDMEQKVITQTCSDARKSKKWMYADGQQYYQKRGSGNNWAHGFCVHGPGCDEKVMELIQREAEKCDNLGGFLSLMSLAGGTGSGVGAHITQSLRDEFPHSFIVNQVVWPYNTGEVIVQNYNAVLTLSHLYQTADAIVLMENDHLHKICTQLMNVKKVSFRDINKVICHKLASVLQPLTNSSSPNRQNHLGEMLEDLVPHPNYKLLTVKNIPQMSDRSLQFSTFQWPGLLKHLRQMLIADAAMEEGINWDVRLGEETPRGSVKHNRSVSNMLVLRGKDIQTVNVSDFQEPQLYVPWVPPSIGLSVWRNSRTFNMYEKSAALVTNSKSPVYHLNYITEKAWNMFSSRAYVHQYTKHGLAEEDFVDSFAAMEQIISNYNKL